MMIAACAANDEFIAVAINVEFRIILLYRKSIRKGGKIFHAFFFIKKSQNGFVPFPQPQLLMFYYQLSIFNI